MFKFYFADMFKTVKSSLFFYSLCCFSKREVEIKTFTIATFLHTSTGWCWSNTWQSACQTPDTDDQNPFVTGDMLSTCNDLEIMQFAQW